ncbi:MAG: AAA family ATPase, partial [Blautia sp.]|nr:AAA family ATPase [Blautia sp.]
MNIQEAKEQVKEAVQAYLRKDDYGEYKIPRLYQRPILLLGAPGIGKTQIMAQICRELSIGLVAYTITHHTRQSAIGLPFIREKKYGDMVTSVTEYTLSEIVAAMYEKMENTVDGMFFATPRGWEDLSRILKVYQEMGLSTGKEVVGQYIQHPAIAG